MPGGRELTGSRTRSATDSIRAVFRDTTDWPGHVFRSRISVAVLSSVVTVLVLVILRVLGGEEVATKVGVFESGPTVVTYVS